MSIKTNEINNNVEMDGYKTVDNMIVSHVSSMPWSIFWKIQDCNSYVKLTWMNIYGCQMPNRIPH